MSHLLKFLFILTLFPAFSQDDDAVYSVYFDATANPGTEKLNVIPEKYFGTFNLVVKSSIDLRGAAGDQLVVDETGIYLLKNRLLSITREEVRENSKYTVKNEYLHGVLDNDSVLVTLEGESYYFLIPKKAFLFDIQDASTRVYKGLNSNEALILSKELNGHYSAIYVTFQGSNVILKELDYDQKELDFRTISGKKKTINGVITYILKPSKKEWQNLMTRFIEYDRYGV